MTDQEQAAVIRMARAGAGYKKIASHLGLPVNTVKSYCRRATTKVDAVCLNCGTPIVQPMHRKVKRFCSDRCRMQWWNDHRDKIKHRSAVKVTCRFCGKEFESYGKQQRVYCSRECYDVARRKPQPE